MNFYGYEIQLDPLRVTKGQKLIASSERPFAYIAERRRGEARAAVKRQCLANGMPVADFERIFGKCG